MSNIQVDPKKYQMQSYRDYPEYKFLNKQQFDAVTAPFGSKVILAGAGSGKTSVLVSRIYFAITEMHIKPERIMAVTFTNKAAKELEYRLNKLLRDKVPSNELSKMTVGTFHSICYRLLRSEQMFNESNFVIWDEDDIADKLVDLLVNGYYRPLVFCTPEEKRARENNTYMPLNQRFIQLTKELTPIEQEVSEYLEDLESELKDLTSSQISERQVLNVQIENTKKSLRAYRNALKNASLIAELTCGKKRVKVESTTYAVASGVQNEISTFKESGYTVENAEKHYAAKYFNQVQLSKLAFPIPSILTTVMSDNEVIRYIALNVYRDYKNYSQDNKMLDFSDLLLMTTEELKKYEIQESVSNQYDLIVVDEFQDTNNLQYQWLQRIAGDNTAVEIVGDDDQSIYGWRGAHPEYMRYFLYDFQKPRAKDLLPATEENHLQRKIQIGEQNSLPLIKLEQNYRSGTQILTAANKVIAQNTDRMIKNLFTKNVENNETIRMFATLDRATEMKYIIEDMRRIIAREKQKGEDYEVNYNDFAILYRTNRIGSEVQTELLKANIPHIAYGAFNFYQRRSVKIAINWLDFCLNMNNDFLFETTFKHIPATKQINPIGSPEGRNGFDPKMLDILRNDRLKTGEATLIDSLANLTTRFYSESVVMQGIKDEFVPENYVSPYATTSGLLTCEFHHTQKTIKSGLLLNDYAHFLAELTDLADSNVDFGQYISNILNYCGIYPYYANAVTALKQREKAEEKTRTGQKTVNFADVSEASRDLEFLDTFITQLKEREQEIREKRKEKAPKTNAEMLREILTDIRLLMDADDKDRKKTPMVNLMTLHGSKGLEFKYVYLVGLSKDVFPTKTNEEDEEHIAEERRLLYVGITRAKIGLVISGVIPLSQFFDDLKMMFSNSVDNNVNVDLYHKNPVLDNLGVFTEGYLKELIKENKDNLDILRGQPEDNPEITAATTELMRTQKSWGRWSDSGSRQSYNQENAGNKLVKRTIPTGNSTPPTKRGTGIFGGLFGKK